jgi:hypothetical protein
VPSALARQRDTLTALGLRTENGLVLLRQLVPSPVELLKRTILNIWREELDQISGVREALRNRLDRLG